MKKTVNKFIAQLMIFALIFSLSGCGEVKKAESAVSELLSALKNADSEKASKYIDLNDLSGAEDGEEFLEDTEILIQNMFKQLDYKILSSEQKDSATVIVTVEITNTDMKPVLKEFYSDALEYAFSKALSGAEQSDEEISKEVEKIFVDCLNKPDLATVTNTADITVVKTEDKAWRIQSDDDFLNALLGGLYEAEKEIEESYSDGE